MYQGAGSVPNGRMHNHASGFRQSPINHHFHTICKRIFSGVSSVALQNGMNVDQVAFLQDLPGFAWRMTVDGDVVTSLIRA